jgi:hypothetical protein
MGLGSYGGSDIAIIAILVASILPMTPLKLKRKSPHLQSTLDRTLQTKTTLSQLVPAFSSPARTVRVGHIAAKEDPQPLRKPCTVFESTADFEEKVCGIIEEDEAHSEYHWPAGMRNKSYIDCSARTKLVRGANWPIPDQVRKLYDEAAAGDARPSFEQGCLPSTAIYYFAI